MNYKTMPFRPHFWSYSKLVLGLLLFMGLAISSHAQFSVLNVSIFPPYDVDPSGAIEVVFDAPVDPSSVSATSFLVHGDQSGFVAGTFSFPGPNQVVFTPSTPFLPGEEVTVELLAGIQGGVTTLMPLSPVFESQFYVAATGAEMGGCTTGSFNQTAFESPTDASGQRGAADIAFADLDGDGDLDGFLLGTGMPSGAHVLVNDGAGGFALTATPYAGAPLQFDVKLGDLDGDGDIDALVSDVFGTTVLLNNGSGVFSIGSLIPGVVQAVDLLDLDGDGDLDLVRASSPIQIMINNGAGVFTASTTTLAATPSDIKIADVNGDGAPDIISVGTAAADNLVFLNSGSGSFTAGTPFGTSAGQAVDLADLDGDGDLDLVVGRFNAPTQVFLNNGAGVFSSSSIFAEINAGDVKFGDMDGDGDLDIITANDGGRTGFIYINDGLAGFSLAPPIGNPAEYGALDIGDLNGDGDLDIFLANATGASAVLQLQCTDLVVTKVASTSAACFNEMFSYSVVISNSGPDNVTGLQVVDTVPAGINITATDNASCFALSGTVSCFGLALLAGDQITVILDATVTSPTFAVTTNKIELLNVNFDTNTANNVTESVVVVSDDEAPVIQNCPASTSVPCGAPLPIPVPSDFAAIDNSGLPVTIDVSTSMMATASCAALTNLMYIYSAYDGCSNVAVCTQLITVFDAIDPVFVSAIEPEVPECVAPGFVPDYVPGSIVFDDACSTVAVTYVDSASTSACEVVYEREYFAADLCGNVGSATSVFNFTVDDSPPLVVEPAGFFDIVISNCLQGIPPPDPAQLSIVENCTFSIQVSTSVNTVASSGCADGMVVYEYEVTDACGAMTIYTQTITVVDTLPPSFTSVPTNQFGCNLVTNIVIQATAIDSCGKVVITASDSVSTSDCVEVIRRVWRATDECDLSTEVTQLISNTVDLTPPSVVIEALVEGCNLDLKDPAYQPNFTDNCLDLSVASIDSVTPPNGDCIERTDRIWTASDGCGNSITVTQQFLSTLDFGSPSFIFVPPATNACNMLPQTNWTGSAIALDDCHVSLSFFDQTNSLTACEYQITRTFVALDDCGNSNTANQIITIFTDSSAPTFSIPPGFGGCGLDFSTNTTGTATATDFCSTPIISYSDTTNTLSPSVTEVLRLWSITDACGNDIVPQVQVITLTNDLFAPVFSQVPTNASGCNLDFSTAFGAPVAMDEVGIAFTNQVDSFSTNACLVTGIRSWTVFDLCGNSSETNQILISTVDGIGPTLTIPPRVGGCMISTSVLATGTAEAFDTCGTANIDFVDTVVVSGVVTTVTRMWTAQDPCGNVSSPQSQIITVTNDFQPPVLVINGLVALDCEEITTNLFGDIIITDDTDVVVIITDSMTTNGCVATGTRSWMVTDACGNASTTSQVLVAVADNEAPILMIPAAIGACNLSTSVLATGTAEAFDTCGTASIDFVDTVVVSGVVTTVTRTWTATDECGNTSLPQSQFITVTNDFQPPVLVINGLVALDCEEITTNLFGDLISTDDTDVVITISDNFSTNGCVATGTRNWEVVDACGNIASTSQVLVAVADNQAPVLMISPAIGGCNISTETNVTGTATATDSCSTPVVNYSDVTNTVGDVTTIQRTWVATDACGLSSLPQVQTIVSTNDLSPPVIISVPIAPPRCNPTQLFFDELALSFVASDEGGSVVTSLVETVVTNGCAVEHAFEFEYYDACGNLSSTNLLLEYLVDTLPPSLIVPPNVFGMDIDTTTNTVGSATASDTCSGVMVSFLDTVNPIGCLTEIQRVWTAEDMCGNQTVGTQFITNSLDLVPPEFTFVPEDRSGCGLAIPITVTPAEAQDACSTAIVTVEEFFMTNGCTVTTLRIWTAEDDAGNVATSNQLLVSTVDNLPPNLTIPDHVEGCNISTSVVQTGLATATDSCGSVTITFKDMVSQSNCTQTIERRWGAIDPCSNTTIRTQLIVNHMDPTSPAIVGCSATSNVLASAGCRYILPSLPLLISDSCSAFGVTQSPPPGTILIGPTSLVVTVVATNSCGLTNECSTLFTIDCPDTFTNMPGYSVTNEFPSGPSPVVGGTITGVVTICNTGNVPLVTLPLQYVYDTNQLLFVSATPAPDDSVNDGILNWTDLGALAPGECLQLILEFVTLRDGVLTNLVSTSPTTAPGVGNPPPQTSPASGVVLPSCPPGVNGVVWYDLDTDGQQGPFEPGVAGVSIGLFDLTNTLVSTAITDQAGAYYLPFTLGQIYYVRFDLPSLPMGTVPTMRDQGADESDSDAFILSGSTSPFEVLSSSCIEHVDLGITFPYSAIQITETVVAGHAGGANCSAALPAIEIEPGAEITFCYEVENLGSAVLSNVVIQSDLFGVNLSLGSLAPGQVLSRYSEEFGQAELGVTATTAGDDHLNHSVQDADIAIVRFIRDSSIGDFIWLDEDKDGIQDDGEPGLQGIKVELLDANSNVLAVTCTAPDGSYSFDGLLEGDYIVHVIPPPGYNFTKCVLGNPEINSDFGHFGFTELISLATFEDLREIDGGLCFPNLDTDGDGLTDDYEVDTGLDPLIADADADTDGDGYSNEEEFIAGTDPTDADSYLMIVDEPFSQAQGKLSFPTVTTRNYEIEACNDMTDGGWETVKTGIHGTGTILTVPEPSSLKSYRFFRIRAVMP